MGDPARCVWGGLCVKGCHAIVLGSSCGFTWSEAACPRMIIWETSLLSPFKSSEPE